MNRLCLTLALLLAASLRRYRLHAQARDIPSAAPVPTPRPDPRAARPRPPRPDGRSPRRRRLAPSHRHRPIRPHRRLLPRRTQRLQRRILRLQPVPHATQPDAERIGFITDKSMILPGKKIDVVQIWTPTTATRSPTKARTAPQGPGRGLLRRRNHSIEAVISDWLKQPGVIVIAEGTTMVERRLAEKVTVLSRQERRRHHRARCHHPPPPAPHLRVAQRAVQGPRRGRRRVRRLPHHSGPPHRPHPHPLPQRRHAHQRFLTKVEYSKACPPNCFDPDHLRSRSNRQSKASRREESRPPPRPPRAPRLRHEPVKCAPPPKSPRYWPLTSPALSLLEVAAYPHTSQRDCAQESPLRDSGHQRIPEPMHLAKVDQKPGNSPRFSSPIQIPGPARWTLRRSPPPVRHRPALQARGAPMEAPLPVATAREQPFGGSASAYASESCHTLTSRTSTPSPHPRADHSRRSQSPRQDAWPPPLSPRDKYRSRGSLPALPFAADLHDAQNARHLFNRVDRLRAGPGRFPPRSRISAPSSSIFNPRRTAAEPNESSPPSEKLSGVRFRIPSPASAPPNASVRVRRRHSNLGRATKDIARFLHSRHLHLRPLPQQVVIHPGQLHRSSPSPPPCACRSRQPLDRCIQIEQQRPLRILPDHALHPEEAAHPRPPRHRLHTMQARRRIQHHRAPPAASPVRPVGVLHHQLAAVILLRRRQKQRRRKIRPDPLPRRRHLPDRRIHMRPKRLPARIAVEHRRKHPQRQRRRHKPRTTAPAPASTISPSSAATGCPSGICAFRFTSCAW